MLTRPLASIVAICACILGSPSPKAIGAAIAFDDTSTSIYATDWASGHNGGFGFTPWVINPSPDTNAGAFVADSGLNAGGSGNINQNGISWGLYARDPGTLAEAIRRFTPGGSNGSDILGIGEKFILKMDNGFVDAGGAVGFGLRNALGENRFEFFIVGGQDAYTLNIETDVQTAHGFTGDGMTLTFTLTGPDTFRLEIDFATGSPSTETFEGSLQGTPGTGIDRFRLFNFAAGVGGKNVFYNSVEVIPEPGTAVLLAVSALLVIQRRRRS